MTDFTADQLAKEAKASTTIKLPTEIDVVGELLSAEELKEQGITLLSVQNADDEVVTISTSSAYWKKVGRPFVEGSIVKFSYENRIAGKTGYKSPSGEIVAHTADGMSLVRATKFSQLAYMKMLDSRTKETDIATLEAVEVERVGAIASYLGSYVRR